MFPKCSYCRHKIICELNGQNREKAEEMYEILEEAREPAIWRDIKRRPTVSARRRTDGNVAWQFVRENKIWYDKNNKVVYCIVLRCQLNKMIKEYRL